MLTWVSLGLATIISVSNIHLENAYQDESRLASGQLGDVPLVGVRPPDPQPVPLLQPQREEARGKLLRLPPQLGERFPDTLWSIWSGKIQM